jgi:tetratricopeptide (TPR) repeat protein
MFKSIKITDELAAEHDRIFQEARAATGGQIPLHGQSDMPVPSWLSAQKLRHAIALFERVLQINPENWSAMWFIGKIHQRFRNTSEALSWFERSYQVNPSQPDIAREASLCAMEIGRHDAAISLAHRATQIEPTNAGLHANLALAYLLAGRLSDAQMAVERASASDPSDTISQTIRAMIQHFAANGRVPPATTPALLGYWRTARKK